MGLAASQARLLSITARLSDNELHSQQIANSKVRLADKTEAASQDYINALNSTKLMYTTYDTDGNASYKELTPSLLYTYAPLKNQYIMKDANGIPYVTATDARNYENTNSLFEFLKCYDLLTDEKYQEAMEDYEQDMADYEKEMAVYEKEMAVYEKELADYEKALADYNAALEKYEKEYEEYLENLSKPSLYDKFAGFVGTSSNPNGHAGFCYEQALTGNTGCYRHLLAHLLDYGGGDKYNTGYDYETSYLDPSTGERDTTQIIFTEGGMTSYVENEPGWLEIVETLNDPERKCDGDDSYNGTDDTTKDNIIQQAIDAGRTPTKKEILMSDYIYDPETNTVTGVKTLKQKAIDLLYILNNSSEITFNKDEMKQSLINFTDGDMKNLASPPNKPEDFTEKPPELPPKPKEPEKPLYSVELNDQEKAQWYVNLWYMMNGSDTANLVKKDNETDKSGIFVVESAAKSDDKGNYKVLEDNLLTSETWLQFALEHGIVTLSQAQYTNPSEDSGKVSEVTSEAITWKSTIYSTCSEISSVEDDIAIAKAEAEYTRTLKEIENKDKKYDNDLKKLDTEHNALQTEYDSVKSVIEKNTERSFKAFS